MRTVFEIAEEKDVRVWNKYMSSTYEHLSKKESTLQDAGLYQGQVGFIHSTWFQHYIQLQSKHFANMQYNLIILLSSFISLRISIWMIKLTSTLLFKKCTKDK